MTGLGLLWLVQSATGSFVAAGAVIGSFAIAEALLGPLTARLIDRFGQSRLLPVLLVAHSAAIAALVVTTTAGASTTILCTVGAAAGASLPQLGACSAARWSRLLDDRSMLSSAFALETTVNDLAFLAGPALVVGIAAGWSPVAATVAATLLVISGGAVLASQRRTAPPPATPTGGTRKRHRTLLRRRFIALVGVNAGLGMFFGSMQLAMTATVVASGRPGLGGILYSLLSAASLVGGLAFGARQWRASPSRRLVVLTFFFAAAASSLLLPAGLVWLAVTATAAGLAIGPIMITSATLIEETVLPAVLTQAFTWANSASAAGIAAAAALAGYLIDQHGARTGFVVTVAGTLIALTGALLVAGRPSRSSQQPEKDVP